VPFTRHPHAFSTHSREFVSSLLCVDQQHRLGCRKGGASDVRKDVWFKGLDWKRLEAKEQRAPYVPDIRSPTDVSNFDEATDYDDTASYYPREDFPPDMFSEFATEWATHPPTRNLAA
jgi:hypothetical protein